MDNYELKEVETIISKNLLTPDVLKNILKNATRRVELYRDEEAIKILNFLATNDSIPNETKEEINKYLAQYDNYSIQNTIKDNKGEKCRTSNIIVLFLVIVILIIVYIFLLNKR